MIQSNLTDYKGRPVILQSQQMEDDFIAARRELQALNQHILITSAGRSEEENKEDEKKYGYSGGTQHLTGSAMDIVVSGITAFQNGGHKPTQEGLAAAKNIQGVMAKHGFQWAGESDIVHFHYTKNPQAGTVVATGSNKKQTDSSPTQSFFDQFDRLAPNLTKLDKLPNKSVKKMADFLLGIGRGKLVT